MTKKPFQKTHVLLRYALLACGHVFLVIGVIGIFLPLLPTTPFLLLAAWCYSKGSEAFETWLVSHKYLGPPIVAWRTHRVVRPGAKVLAGVVITSSLIWVWLLDHVPLIGKIGMTVTVVPILLYVITRKNSIS